MDANIITRFTIATQQGMDVLLYLTQAIAREKFLPLLSGDQVEIYVSAHCSEQTLTAEVNSMSNQWLVVYVKDQPAGFARITSKGERPGMMRQKRVIRLADFGVLQAYDHLSVRQSLLNKCLAVCKSYEAVWINEYTENPYLSLFESAGFIRQAGTNERYELPLVAVVLIKEL